MVLINAFTFVAWLFTISCASASSSPAAVELPPHHPMQHLIKDFGGHLRCPYAEEWLKKGPRQAALDLGLIQTPSDVSSGKSRGLRRDLSDDLAGSCTYVDPWSNQPACLEMRGALWTTESMQTRCDESKGTVSTDTCPLPPSLAGWCIIENTEGGIEANPFSLASGMGCAAIEGLCGNMMSGEFEPAAECGATTDSSTKCEIGMGPIGAAHQSGFSDGYLENCPGTPAEGSPYMWPVRMSADIESQSMKFGSDDIIYHTRGKVFYRLDKNWKRSDTYYQRGVQRNIGQAPCDAENRQSAEGEALLACQRDSDSQSTMIHRGNKMMFIDWKDGIVTDDAADITSCRMMDLGIIGNVRPDWYMDDRGDSTDVQYLGDQHVYYENQPRLVKQWRKKDFANQYFTMSMLANPGEDGQHWPVILNVPGEGFGDDFLQKYTNHSLLTDEDDALFLLDEALEAIGNPCTMMESEGGGGPPTGEAEHVPSNLEVDENAWFTNVYTFSPIWKPPMQNVLASEMDAMRPGPSTSVEEGLASIDYCFDKEASAVRLSVTFKGVAEEDNELPWIALGYRESEECLMNPRGGGDSDMILLTTENGDGVPVATFGPLLRSAKNFEPSAISSVYDGLVPLSEAAGFSEVDVSLVSHASPTAMTSRSTLDPDSVRLSFVQRMDASPEAMHLMYAVGTSSQLGYHGTRMCFELKNFSPCMEGEKDAADVGGVDGSNIFDKYTNEQSSTAAAADVKPLTSSSTAFAHSGFLSVAFTSFITLVAL